VSTESPPQVFHPHNSDEQRLAELGYRQELRRKWSGFSNFAISFSIISILSGCFTTFGQAWNNGGPIAISLGWPLISLFILIIGLSMSELVSAYPTAGGIYFWALKLGKPIHGWFTGWLNLVGLIAVTASVCWDPTPGPARSLRRSTCS
jgi:amino acid transporter